MKVKDPAMRDRLATIRPLELHRAIGEAAVRALREGAPLEQVDAMEFYSLEGLGLGTRNVVEQRRQHLLEKIDLERRVIKTSRRNANLAASDDARRDFLVDSDEAYREVARLEKELAELDVERDSTELPVEITSQLDYLAYAIGHLASVSTVADGSFADDLKRILKFDRMTPVPQNHSVEVAFRLVIPAAGKVLTFGPITAVVTNSAYEATLPEELQSDTTKNLVGRTIKAILPENLRTTNQNRALRRFRDAMYAAGYAERAVKLLSLSNNPSLYNVIANEVWGAALNEGVTPEYAEHIRRVFRQDPIPWGRLKYRQEVTMRQMCVDYVTSHGGRVTQGALRAAAAEKGYSAFQIDKIHLRKPGHGHSPLEPVLARVDDRRIGPKGNLSEIRLIDCPYCGGTATKVLRVPEVSRMLLCRDCLRMPVHDSPTFPESYLRL